MAPFNSSMVSRASNPFGLVPRGGGLLDSLIDPPSLPAWLAPADLDKFVRAFSISGFLGGLNYYRAYFGERDR